MPDPGACRVLRPWRAQIGSGGGNARRGLVYLDATCPLVSKVHMEAERHGAYRVTMSFSSAMPGTPRCSAPWANCRRLGCISLRPSLTHALHAG